MAAGMSPRTAGLGEPRTAGLGEPRMVGLGECERRLPCRGEEGEKGKQKTAKTKWGERRHSLLLSVCCSVRVRGERRSEETRRIFSLQIFNTKHGRHSTADKKHGVEHTINRQN